MNIHASIRISERTKLYFLAHSTAHIINDLRISICPVEHKHDCDTVADCDHSHAYLEYTGPVPIWALQYTVKDLAEFLIAPRDNELLIQESVPNGPNAPVGPNTEKLWKEFRIWLECRQLVNQSLEHAPQGAAESGESNNT